MSNRPANEMFGGSGRVLVGVDGSELATTALEWAVTETQRRGGILEIHAASGPGRLFSDGHFTLDPDQIVGRSTERARQIAPEITPVSKTHGGLAATALIEASDGADLLVVGSRGLGGFNGLRLGSVSRKCAHGARCPVAIVRPMEHAVANASPEREFRIVAGTDGRPPSLAALDWAASEAHLCSSDVEVVTAWEWPTTSGLGTSLAHDRKANAQAILDAAIETAREAHPDVGFRPFVLEGHPARILVEASSDADLVVVGSRGHGEFVGMFLGSVSDHCITHAHCPVVVHR